MSIDVRYMPEGEIEAEAAALLAEHARKTGVRVAVPALLLDDLLQHLGLRLDLDDLRAMLGLPDVLGAIWIERRHIYIDQTLDPDERPAMRGRFNFSLAHEIGHWRLHRGYVEPRHAMGDLFGEPPRPTVICRTSQKRERIEVQADGFAGYLLMPRDVVRRAWQRTMGPERLRLSDAHPEWPRLVAATCLWRGAIRVDPREQQDDVIEFMVRPLAEEFQVSPQAMRIRLERLGWVVRDLETAEPLFGAA
jgi:Zn-dependent peptidase ImmA (M78 family)